MGAIIIKTPAKNSTQHIDQIKMLGAGSALVFLGVLCYTSASFQHQMSSEPHERIIGGNVAPRNEANFIVAIKKYYPGDSWNICGGSLISELHILTSAHSMKGTIHNKIMIGSHNLDNRNEFNIQWKFNATYITHEEHNPKTKHNDIAIVILPSRVELTGYVSIMSLPMRKGTDNEYVDKMVTIYCWGKIHDSQDARTQINDLRSVTVPVISNEICRRSYRNLFEGNICTAGRVGPNGQTKVGSCRGDSGGPLVLGNELIGIVSYSKARCEVGYPSVYTRVDQYLDWIRRNTGLEL